MTDGPMDTRINVSKLIHKTYKLSYLDPPLAVIAPFIAPLLKNIFTQKPRLNVYINGYMVLK